MTHRLGSILCLSALWLKDGSFFLQRDSSTTAFAVVEAFSPGIDGSARGRRHAEQSSLPDVIHLRQRPSSSSSSSSAIICAASSNPNDFETPEERRQRMKLVEQIQNTFYQDEPDNEWSQPDEADPSLLRRVPLWRVQWTELPGYQNVLNCHVPHYTHMFQRLVRGPQPWLFGHVFLPGGSENLDNPEYRLPDERTSDDETDDDIDDADTSPPSQATLTGTLMRVTDYQQLPDGRLALIVQALERMEIVGATQHAPYAVAHVRLRPDNDDRVEDSDEYGDNEDSQDNDNSQRRGAALESLEWRDWEFRPTTWNDAANNTAGVSPLVNYDDSFFPSEIVIGNQPSSNPDESSQVVDAAMERMERHVWIALDTMIQLLARLNPNLRIPVPTQMLGLLPILESDNGAENNGENNSWPPGFQLERHAQTLQRANAQVGTGTKSPFIRTAENAAYPPRRRAARLSYAIWCLLESLPMVASPSRQDILQETSAIRRLALAEQQLNAINQLLQSSLPRS